MHGSAKRRESLRATPPQRNKKLKTESWKLRKQSSSRRHTLIGESNKDYASKKLVRTNLTNAVAVPLMAKRARHAEAKN